MLAISLDRYRAVLFPLKPRLTKRATMFIISLTWFLALAVSLPVAIHSKMKLRVIDRYGNTRYFCEEIWEDIELRFFYSLGRHDLAVLPAALYPDLHLHQHRHRDLGQEDPRRGPEQPRSTGGGVQTQGSSSLYMTFYQKSIFFWFHRFE